MTRCHDDDFRIPRFGGWFDSSVLGCPGMPRPRRAAGEPIRDAENPADVQFLKSGEWSVLHYGGFLQCGKYSVAGDKLTMNSEDGSVYMDGKMNYKAAEQILEINDGTYLMRLRRMKAK
jgi:hypothetical protein